MTSSPTAYSIAQRPVGGLIELWHSIVCACVCVTTCHYIYELLTYLVEIFASTELELAADCLCVQVCVHVYVCLVSVRMCVSVC